MATEAMDPAQAFENKVLARLEPVNKLTARGTSTVQQFYSGLTVFVTGGSGFVGKQLIEKLLRATNISKVFMLLRCKKGKSIQQRLTEILKDPLYDTLRQQKPHFDEKIVAISGDVAELKLGLSGEDWTTVTEQVDIIFHVAATTRFDEPLRVATLINLRGTREALLLGKACKKLRSYVHVSTAYSHACTDNVNTKILEKFYKCPVEPNTMIKLVETVSEEKINDITPSLITDWPNTYTFAKALAEELVNSMGDDLPICIVRPAIVICTKCEPTPGWLDVSCVFGASGIVLTSGLGIMRVVYVDGSTAAELIPVDYVNNAILVAAWDTSANKSTADGNKINIYNLSSFSRNPITWDHVLNNISEHGRKYPSPMMVAYPNTWYINNPVLFWILSWFFHLLPAYIIDGICIIIGKERRFAKLANKMHKLAFVIPQFVTKHWVFDDKNTEALFNKLSADDQEIFHFNVTNIDWQEYMVIWCIGLRRYIIKDGLKGTISSRIKEKVFKFLAFIILPLYVFCLFKVASLIIFLFFSFFIRTSELLLGTY